MSTEQPHSRATLSDVARAAGVAPSTASLVFSGRSRVAEKTRAKVEAAAASLGYSGPDPRARSLRSGRSHIVGVVVPSGLSESFRDPMLLLTLDGLSDEIAGGGSSLLLIPDRGAVDVSTAPVDAVVVTGCSVFPIDSARALLRRKIPVISIEGERIDGVHDIGIANIDGSRSLAEHLHGLGHRKVAMVTLPIDEKLDRGRLTPARESESSRPTTRDRIAGVRAVYPDAPGITTRGSQIEEGLAAGLSLLAGDPASQPTAIIAQSDLLAAGVIRAAERLGLRVPEDLSVTGFDGITVDGLGDSLTTAVQPARGKGVAAGRAIAGLLAGAAPEPVEFPVGVRLGTTTGPAPRIA